LSGWQYSNLFIWPSMWTRLDHANDWEKKATCSAYLSTIIKHFLEFAPSNGKGPTDPLHLSCICSIWKILHFYSSLSLNPSKSAFFHALTFSLLPKNHKQIIFIDIQHIIRLSILSNFNNLDMKLSFWNQKYVPYFLRIITIMVNQYVFFK
jgi:hypothetical protein